MYIKSVNFNIDCYLLDNFIKIKTGHLKTSYYYLTFLLQKCPIQV